MEKRSILATTGMRSDQSEFSWPSSVLIDIKDHAKKCKTRKNSDTCNYTKEWNYRSNEAYYIIIDDLSETEFQYGWETRKINSSVFRL